jgi:hypothetical protein
MSAIKKTPFKRGASFCKLSNFDETCKTCIAPVRDYYNRLGLLYNILSIISLASSIER